MPKINIISKREGMMSRYDMKVYLDGKIMGYLPLGTSKEFDVPVGEHKLKAKMGFYRSKECSFTMFNKDLRTFTVSINKSFVVPILILISVAVILQISTEESFKQNDLYAGICSALVVLVLAYFLFIGRNTFLKVKEVGQE
jgi:hypothetical protein